MMDNKCRLSNVGRIGRFIVVFVYRNVGDNYEIFGDNGLDKTCNLF